MYQPYYIVGGKRVTKSETLYKKLKEEDMLREKFAEHSTSMKQILESFQEYKNFGY